LRKNPDLSDPEILPVPVRILLLAILIRRTLAVVTLPLLARQAWSSIAVVATIIGIVWCFVRLIGYAEKNFRLRFGRRNLNGGLSILRFVCSALDGLIIFIGLLFLLHHFGINATTALAGLGVGGIAIALAAQKTLENVIAGISLISDKAIRVGDFLKMADTLGTVTDIGLRSTRIRTLDRTIVNLPNGQIANASLENYSLRDQFWFHPIVRLSYETTVAQLRSILEEITALMRRYSGIDLPSVRARLLQFGESSLDIEIFAYLYAADYPDFLRIQEDLLLQIMDVIEAAGARIAVPARSMYVNTPGNRESDREPASRMLIHEPVTQNK
ncbi:MAG: mechanosensitive ion channel family protein, partial [Acidobacteriaceae bacterium]|nr:mechanosensitive ion channel family protein [Acidobacteriaceae bacterium]